jgi:hypothetical protein
MRVTTRKQKEDEYIALENALQRYGNHPVRNKEEWKEFFNGCDYSELNQLIGMTKSQLEFNKKFDRGARIINFIENSIAYIKTNILIILILL